MSLWDNIKERVAINKLLGLSRDVLKLSNNMIGGSEEGFFSKLKNGVKNAVGKIKGFVSKRFSKPVQVRRPIKIGEELLKKIEAGKKLTKKADGLVSESEQFRQEVRARSAQAREEARAGERQKRANARVLAASEREGKREERKKGAVAEAQVSKLQVTASRTRNTASKLSKMAKTPGIDSKNAKKLSEGAAAFENAAGAMDEVRKLQQQARANSAKMKQSLVRAEQRRGRASSAPKIGRGQSQGAGEGRG